MARARPRIVRGFGKGTSNLADRGSIGRVSDSSTGTTPRRLLKRTNPSGKDVGTGASLFGVKPLKRPTNPHDPTSKDPFMRAGMSMGKNDTDIFSRAGISMNRKRRS